VTNNQEAAAGLLMELEDCNCWSIAEAVGHPGPHRLQHLLSRAVWDDQQVLDAAAAWAVAQLDDGDAVLVVDETADEKSSAGAVGAARQYSGTAGGIALCQVAVTLTFATSRGHTLIGRSLYLPGECAADEEHRELAGVPEQVMFATKPELARALLQRVHQRGIRAAFVTGDEVYGGRDLRRAIRALGMGYVLAVRANHALTLGSGRTVTAGRGRQADPGRRLAADAHRTRHQLSRRNCSIDGRADSCGVTLRPRPTPHSVHQLGVCHASRKYADLIGRRAGLPQDVAAGAGDVQVHAVLLVIAGVEEPVRGDPVDRDESAVDDHVGVPGLINTLT
jgi:SRSO17 transposase